MPLLHSHSPETDPLLERAERGGGAVHTYQARSQWSNVRHKFRKAFAEFFGTLILVAFGSGAIAQLGAHLNPAVTLAQAIFRGFAWAEVPVYWLAQFAGAFAGALIVYVFNYAAIKDADPATTVGIFITGLQTEQVSTCAAFIAEFLGTALLVLVIFATSDKGNNPAGNTQPLIIGLSLAAIGLSFGYQTGFALNPARDLAPRLFTAVFGWGFEVFTRQSWYFWVPIAAPFAGAVSGAFVYDVLIYGGPSPLNN
ncbi:hypothetical protein BGZ98_002207 [Dissophora globulifera]|nr:hypothetical protein BGZ98_002207 [Dissophora globulifera]